MVREILLKKERGAAEVTFNRPEVRNALTPAMLLELADFLDKLASDPDARYLVFRGEGGHFSAGGDVASYRDALGLAPAKRRQYFERRVRANLEAVVCLSMLPIPVISLVRGAVAGAGLSIVLASDFVLASEESFLLFAQPKVGLPIDLGLSYFLPRVVGLKAAKKLALTAARLQASEAKALGIVDEIHRPDALEEGLNALVRRFEQVAPRAIGRSKQLLVQSEHHGIVEQMEQEVRAIGASVAEPDFAEGVNAFLEKRPPSFTGAEGAPGATTPWEEPGRC